MNERRRSPRYEVDRGITGHLKPTIEVRVVDISEHGLMIESPSGLPPAGICELTINTPKGTIKIRARVARCRAQMVRHKAGKVSVRFHAGLEFLDDFAEGFAVKELISAICTLKIPAADQPMKRAM